MITDRFFEKLDITMQLSPDADNGVDCMMVILESEAININAYVKLIYLMEGDASVKISFNEFELSEGDFLLINPGEVHRIKGINGPVKLLYFNIETGLFSKFNFIFNPIFYNTMKRDLCGQVASLMLKYHNLLHMLSDNHNSSKQAPNALVGVRDEIIRICENNFAIQYFDPENLQEMTRQEMTHGGDRAAKLYDYLYANFMKKITLKDVANFLNVDMSYASRIIHKETGAGFKDLISIVRVDRSEILVLGTDMQIMDIAEQIGFSSYEHFIKYFKERFGHTPSQHRKLNYDNTYPNAGHKAQIVGTLDGKSYSDWKESVARHLMCAKESLLENAKATNTVEVLSSDISVEHGDSEIVIRITTKKE